MRSDDSVIDETVEAWDTAARMVAEGPASNDPQTRLRGNPMQPVFQVHQHQMER
jgi:hypothetical protein